MVKVRVRNLIFYSVEIYPNFGLVKEKKESSKIE